MTSDDDDVVVQNAPTRDEHPNKLSHLQALEAWLLERLEAVRRKIDQLRNDGG